ERVGSPPPRRYRPWLKPSETSSADQAVVCSLPSGRNLDRAVEVVKSLEFEARIRARAPFRANSTRPLPPSTTNAPLLPARRRSLPRPAASLVLETAVRALAAPWAIGVLKARSGPPFAACEVCGSVTTAATSSVPTIAPVCLDGLMPSALLRQTTEVGEGSALQPGRAASQWHNRPLNGQ